MEQSKVIRLAQMSLVFIAAFCGVVGGIIGSSLGGEFWETAIYALGAFCTLYALIVFIVYAIAVSVLSVIRKVEDEH